MKVVLPLLILLAWVVVPTAMAKRYADPDAVPFMKLSDALKIAEEALAQERLDGYEAKEAQNLHTNGGECWAFVFVSSRKDNFAVEVYAGRRVRTGRLLTYPFRPEDEIKQLKPSVDSAK